jgi:hypothetical protein
MERTGIAKERLKRAERRLKRCTTDLRKAADAYARDPLDRRLATALERKQELLADARAELERATEAVASIDPPASARADIVVGAAATPRVFELRSPGAQPRREQTLTVLDAIGVPMSARVISQIGAAHFGFDLPVKQLSSIRRDDRRRIFDRDPDARPAYVAPALAARSLAPIPRLFTSSAWPPERRLVGARSARADQLRTLLALLNLREAHEDNPRIDIIIRRYAINVPEAVAPGRDIDPERIRHAAEAELAQIAPLDAEERDEAVARFGRLQLTDQIWGIEHGETGRRLRAVGEGNK